MNPIIDFLHLIQNVFNLNIEGNSDKFQDTNQFRGGFTDQPLVKEKYVLALLIKSDRYQDLIHSLDKNEFLQTKDSPKLYGATQGLWIGAKNKYGHSQIKQKLDNCISVNNTSEYDVHFVTIELDENDSRFCPDVNPMDRRDAFIELGNLSPQVTVSSRLSCKDYENTEFYNR